MRIVGCRATNWHVSESPLLCFCILISTSITSGRSCEARANASLLLSASPTTSSVGSLPSTDLSPTRTMASSSTINRRVCVDVGDTATLELAAVRLPAAGFHPFASEWRTPRPSARLAPACCAGQSRARASVHAFAMKGAAARPISKKSRAPTGWNAGLLRSYLTTVSPQFVTSRLVSMRRLEPVTWRSLQKKARG